MFEEAAIAPRADARRLAAHLGLDPLELVLRGGEDYVLLFTLPAKTTFRHAGCRRIGRITSRSGMSLLRRDGRLDPLSPEGWDHLG